MQAGASAGISVGLQAPDDFSFEPALLETPTNILAADIGGNKAPNLGKIVLDVGGTVFTTSLATLGSGFAGNSWFAARFSGKYSDSLEGRVFIDRDPVYFHLVLSYLRDGWCILPDGLQELRRLRAEAEFYSLLGYSLLGLLDLIDQSPIMLVFFRALMVASPESDWQDKLHCLPGSHKYVECLALNRVASEAERAAAYKYTRDMRSHIDASLALCLPGKKLHQVFRLSFPGADEYETVLEGCYVHVSGAAGNGFPVWKQEGANNWLFSDINGYWAFYKIKIAVACEMSDMFKTDMSFVRSHSVHQGALPSGVEAWCRARDGGFIEDSEIRVTSEKPRDRE